MKTIAVTLLLGLSLLRLSAGELPWHTDLAKALDKAKAEKKLVLIDFTGSDW